jgi:hypothetical protein
MNPPGELRTANPNAVRVPERIDLIFDKERIYGQVLTSVPVFHTAFAVNVSHV